MNKHIRVFLSWLFNTDWNPAVIITPFLSSCFIFITLATYWLFVDSIVKAGLIAFISILIIIANAFITDKIADVVPNTIYPFREYKKRKWRKIKIVSDREKDIIVEWWAENGKGLVSREWDALLFSSSEDATYVMLKWGGDNG